MSSLLRGAVLAATFAVLAAFLGACASPTGGGPAPAQRAPEPPPPAKAAEVSPKDRANLHADLGAGYYERGRMDIALEELNEAMTLDPGNPRIYNYFGLVYTVLGENARVLFGL